MMSSQPDRLATRLEELGKIDRFPLEFYHAGIQSGKEQDVVDELQQVSRVLLDLLDEQRLVVCSMIQFKEFSKTNDRAEGSTNLVAHVRQE